MPLNNKQYPWAICDRGLEVPASQLKNMVMEQEMFEFFGY